MEIADELTEAFAHKISDLRSDRFRTFPKEVPIIKATVDVLDNIRIEVDAKGGQSLWVITKQTHLTPRVEFFLAC